MSYRRRGAPCRLVSCTDMLHSLVLRHHRNLAPCHQLIASASKRPASSTATSDRASKPGKPIVLDKPDKFRPPSHPSRLNARRSPRHYPGPPIPQAEKEAQVTRRYPHMFPNKGSWRYWFLTNKLIHLYISLGTLTLLCVITLTQSFLHTSPFARLIPSLSTFPVQPLTYMTDWFNVIRLHQQYNTNKTAERRSDGIADAQKRRLWRRAHGMEDLDEGDGEGDGASDGDGGDEDVNTTGKEKTGRKSLGGASVSGVDVRGLVPWDDGLSGAERREVKAAAARRRGRQVEEQGGGLVATAAAAAGSAATLDTVDTVMVGNGNVDGDGDAEPQPEQPRRRRPLKKWLGIW